LELATINASNLGQRAFFAESDLFAALDGNFDLILANPPYIADARHRAYRDGGGALGMELSLRIVREGIQRLTQDGVLFLYTGVPIMGGVDLFRAAAEQIVESGRCSIEYDEIDPDVFGEELDQPAYRDVERIAAVKLMITRLRI
jgi:release factor glutamine methyltransferase